MIFLVNSSVAQLAALGMVVRVGVIVETSVTLSFEDAVFGVEKKISLMLDVECEHCHGDGAELDLE